MLYVFYGPNTYSRDQAIRQLQHDLDSDGMLSTNTVTLDGARVALPEIMAACDTVPFLSSHRLVVVRGLLARAQPQVSRARSGRATSGRAQKPTAQKSNQLDLASYVARMPDTTVLLLIEETISAGNPLLQALQPKGDVRFFQQLGPGETAGWIRDRVRSLGATIDPNALQALVEIVGSNLWTLESEVDKLSLHAGGRAITEEDVRSLVAAAQESNVFTLVDAVLDGRLDVALTQLRLLLQGGAAGPYLITMIARQYRQLLIVQDLARSGSPAPAVMRAAEIRSESALRRLRHQAQRWSPARLLAAYERILLADRSIKRGEMNEDLALELLLGDLSAN